MPIQSNVALTRAGLRINRRLLYGGLAEFSMLDDRQYRTDNPCGDGESLRCDTAVSGNYTMLGRTQEQWLARGLTHSDAMWNIVGQQLLLAELEHATIQPNWFWNDAWDGYPLARQRLLTDVVTSGVRNPVFLTGDWHSTFVHGDSGADALDLRFVTSVENPLGTGYAEASWVVQDGTPGAETDLTTRVSSHTIVGLIGDGALRRCRRAEQPASFAQLLCQCHLEGLQITLAVEVIPVVRVVRPLDGDRQRTGPDLDEF